MPWSSRLGVLLARRAGLFWLVLATAAAGIVLRARMIARPLGEDGPASCLWWTWFGVPCPACGCTAAFVWMTRGNLQAAWAATPVGVVLFLVCLGLVPTCIVLAFRRTPPIAVLAGGWVQDGVLALSLLTLALWLMRMVAFFTAS